MAKRNRPAQIYNDYRSHRIPSLEMKVTAWFLPEYPPPSDVFPSIVISEDHTVLSFEVIRKTTSNAAAITIQRALVDNNGDTGAFSNVATVNLPNGILRSAMPVIQSKVSGNYTYRVINAGINLKDATVSMIYQSHIAGEE